MNKDEAPRPKFFTSGWRQFLNSKIDLLRRFDSARIQSSVHEVEAFHGRVAEAEFRRWLSEFLPKKYGVTSGYIISPAKKSTETKLPHFDVIIYDVLEAPILWIEGSPDASTQGHSRAIPVEHVCCVFEVKSQLTPKTISKGLEHLSDLKPLIQDVNQAGDRRNYLRNRFCCGLIFFEIKKEHEYSNSILDNILIGISLGGFTGGIVLRGDGISEDQTGIIELNTSATPHQTTVKRGEESLIMSSNIALGAFERNYSGGYLGSSIHWNRNFFANFSFDLIDRLQGSYEYGRRSSWYGFVGADYIGDTPQIGSLVKPMSNGSI